ncbi:MAG: hypothetical protein WDN49_11400 [Acetobacteraceae bacterium]
MTESNAPIASLMASEAYRRAVATLAAEHERTVEDIVTLTQIPSPPFQEAERAGPMRACSARMAWPTWRWTRSAT